MLSPWGHPMGSRQGAVSVPSCSAAPSKGQQVKGFPSLPPKKALYFVAGVCCVPMGWWPRRGVMGSANPRPKLSPGMAPRAGARLWGKGI